MNRNHPVITRHLVSRWLLACAAWLLGGVAAPALATTISAGYEHSCSVSDAGVPTCWGSVPLGHTRNVGVADIQAGASFSCALHKDSTVTCWGDQNAFGQLGASPGGSNLGNTLGYRDGEDWKVLKAVQLATGARHACALTLGGDVYCWGDADQGQLGVLEPARTMTYEPVKVQGLSNVSRIAAGNASTCAVLHSGSAWCLGTGSLLDGVQADPRIPRQVPGITDAKDVSILDGHACVLRTGGQVACWGRNLYGQLGVPSGVGTRTIPVEVAGLPGPAKAIATGYGFSCALLADGTIRCWGDYTKGALGIGYLPVGATQGSGQVLGITDAVAISAGLKHACAVLDGGYVQCWGAGNGLGHGLCSTFGAYYPGFMPYSYPSFNLAVCFGPGSSVPFAVLGLGPGQDAGVVMDWAERSLPEKFTRSYGTSAPERINDIYYRYYPDGTYLAINGHGTPHLMYMGPDTNGQLRDLGRLATWAREARK